MIDSFSDNWSYHRNIVSFKNKADGHDVTIITTRYKMGEHGENVATKAGVEFTNSGVKVIRLPDIFPFFPKYLQDRLHWTRGLYLALEKEKPDVIMVHNLQFFNLSEVTKYRLLYPNVKLLGDTHATSDNSISTLHPRRTKFIQRHFIGPLIRRNFKYFDKFSYLSINEKEFFEEMYGINLDDAYMTPLPAPIIPLQEKLEIKKKIRRSLGLAENTFLFVHSGKLAPSKKTEWIFEALKDCDIDCKFLIIGSIPKEQEALINQYLQNELRSEYLGWMDANKLREYIAAADIYLQPGGVSVTYQNAICVGTPVIAYPHKPYKIFTMGGEFFVSSPEDMRAVFERVKADRSILEIMSQKAYETGEKYFSIEKNAEFIYDV
mgnify:CR=1 FL=1